MINNIAFAKEIIARKDFEKVDDIWTEMIISKQTTLNDFFEIASELKKCGESDHALLLLEILASHFESENSFEKTIEVFKNMLRHKKEDTKIREKLVNLYKKLHKNSRYINEYIENSGMDKTVPIFKSLEKLDEFLRYDIGKCFYFERYGFGEVVEAVPSKKEIVINFEKKERHFLTLVIAKGLLIPITKEHFLYKKYKNIDVLKEITLSTPVALIKFMLKSFQEPLTTSQIKMHLQGIIEKENINRWWEKTRKNLEKDNNIKISGKTAKTYRYIESGVDKNEDAVAAFEQATPVEKYVLAQDYAKKMPAIFKQISSKLIELGNKIYEREPALALDILLLCNGLKLKDNFLYTIDTILKKNKPENIIRDLHNLEHQKMLVEIIKETNPNTWTDILRMLLLSANDFKLLDVIAQSLQSSHGKLEDIHHTIFSMSKQYPQQFQWLLKKMQRGKLTEYLTPGLVPRLIDSLGYVKGIKTIMRKILSLDNFDALLKAAKEDDAQRIIAAINNSETLVDYEKKDFSRIIEYYFPHLFTKETDVIYTTEKALNKKKEELNRIYTVEIPENKKEISRAREFGDLSDNFEYKAAKERQDQLYQKLKMLDAELKKVVIINPKKIDSCRVDVGTKVTLKNLQNTKSISYTILGRWDTDLKKNIISNEAPVAKSLVGKVCGNKVTLNDIEYEILKIEKGI